MGRLIITKTERTIIDATLDALAARGLAGHVGRGAKHLVVRFTVAGGGHKVPVASSPRDVDNAADNQRREIERLLDRLMGRRVSRRQRQRADRRVIQRRTEPRHIDFGPPAQPGVGPSRDPWAPLAALLHSQAPAE